MKPRFSGLLLVLAVSLAACATGPKPLAPGTPGMKPAGAPQPVMVGADILSDQPVGAVWELLTQPGHWADWNKKLSQVSVADGLTGSAADSLTVGAKVSYRDDGQAVTATLVELQDQAALVWQGARVGKGVRLHWTVHANAPGSTLLSLRAELKPNASSEQIAQAGAETSDWIGAANGELSRRSAAAKAAEAASAKPQKRHAPKARAKAPAQP